MPLSANGFSAARRLGSAEPLTRSRLALTPLGDLWETLTAVTDHPQPPPYTTSGQRGFLIAATAISGVVGPFMLVGAVAALLSGTEDLGITIFVGVIGLLVTVSAVMLAVTLWRFYRSRRALQRAVDELRDIRPDSSGT